MYKSEITLPVFQNYPGEYEQLHKAKATRSKKDSAYHSDTEQKIKRKLIEDHQMSTAKLYIDTFKGMVLLSGIVESNKDKQIAGEVAKLIVGMAPIKNVLTTKKEAAAG